jgi:hypothetical protein
MILLREFFQLPAIGAAGPAGRLFPGFLQHYIFSLLEHGGILTVPDILQPHHVNLSILDFCTLHE